MAGVKKRSSNKMWFIAIAGIAIGFALIAYSVVAESEISQVAAMLGAIFVFGGLMIRIFSFAVLAGIWQRVVMGLAGSLLLLGGILFETAWIAIDEFTLLFGWDGFSVWSAVLIIAGIGYGIGTVVPPKGVLRRLLVAAGIPVILLSAIGLSAYVFVVAVCACD